MTSCTPVNPSEIQKELDKLEEAHKENKQQRACLFNLIVYAFKSKNPDSYWTLIDQIAKQFPCRILFIEENGESQDNHLNTSLCVKLLSQDHEKRIICEQINVEVSSSRREQTYPLILPHIIPDLPIYLIWAEDPTLDHPLFSRFQQLSHRLIFESDCSRNLQEFCSKLQSNILKFNWEVADLNWVKLESWRKLFKGLFNTAEKIKELQESREIDLKFAPSKNASCQNHYEIHYLHGWLAAQLGWKPLDFQQDQNSCTLRYQTPTGCVRIHIEEDSSHAETEQGSLTYIQIKTETQKKITSTLDANDRLIKIEICDEKKPNEAYNTYLMHAKWELSLSKEICYQETSTHYCNTLNVLSKIKGLG